MQVRTRAEAGATGVGYILAAIDVLTDVDANGIPVQVGIHRDRAVVVQYLDDVGLIHHRRRESAPEAVVAYVDDRALARGVDLRSIGNCDVHRIHGIGRGVSDRVGKGLRDHEGGTDREGHPVGAGRMVLRLG